MGIKTGVKRKTINNSETPNKLRKTDGAFNQKTPNKSHNTPAKNKKMAQTINAIKSPKTYTRKQKKSQKKNKHNPEDEEQSEHESEEDVEVNFNEESDSDEESLEHTKVSNADEQGLDSDEQNESEKEEDEQNDSDGDPDAEEIMKQPNPKKQTHLHRCKFSLYVYGLRGADFQVPDIFKNCNYKFYNMLKKKGEYTGGAFVGFDEEQNYKKALEKNGTVINGVTISVFPKKTDENEYNIIVRNLSHDSNIENIFSDCKIVTRKIIPHSKSALLYLEDEDSMQKALEKDRTDHDSTTITVRRRDCSVLVTGLTKNIKLDEFFSDCKIHNYKLHKNRDTGEFKGTASVHFKDILSYKNALAKNGTEIEGNTITVLPNGRKDIRNRMKNNNINPKKNELRKLKAQVWHLNMGIKKLEFKIGNKPVFKKNSNKPFKKNTNKVFVKKNTNKTFAKKKNNPKK